MKKHDVIPSNDLKFDTFQSNLISLCTANQVAWGITLVLLTALTPLQAAWTAALIVCKERKNSTQAQRTAKNAARKAFEAKLRPFIQSHIQQNTVMSDASKQQCGVNPHKAIKTPVPAPADAPVIMIKAPGNGVVELFFHQPPRADGSSSRGKPSGVANCKYVYMIGATAPTKVEQCNLCAYSSRNPLRLTFDPGMKGQHIWGFACWVNSKNQQGPWSDSFDTTIN